MVIASANNFSPFFPIFRNIIPFSYPVVLAITSSTTSTSISSIKHNASFEVMKEVFYLVKELFI